MQHCKYIILFQKSKSESKSTIWQLFCIFYNIQLLLLLFTLNSVKLNKCKDFRRKFYSPNYIFGLLILFHTSFWYFFFIPLLWNCNVQMRKCAFCIRSPLFIIPKSPHYTCMHFNVSHGVSTKDIESVTW